MTDQSGNVQTAWWAKRLDEIDREIARQATICNVRILDAGVIERVLRNDASVCGSRNQIAFDKLRTVLMMHYSVRDDALDVLGPEKTRLLVEKIVAALRDRIGEGLGGPLDDRFRILTYDGQSRCTAQRAKACAAIPRGRCA